MTKWLTSLFMLAVIGGSVAAGVPLHSGEQECPMHEMKDGVDCCAKAQAQQVTPEVEAARLCCAVNCPSSGTTTPTASLLRVPPSGTAAQHRVVPTTAFVVPAALLRSDSAREHPQHSPPPYIRHHALLI